MNNSDYQLSVNIIGAKELKDAISTVNSVARDALLFALNKTAIDLEASARSKAPHRKGGLWNSIHAQPAKVTQTNIEAHVGTNLKYARAQEAGTQGMTIHSHSRQGKQFTYIGNIPPKWYMRDARNEIKPELTNNLEAAVKKIINHLATRPSNI